jgi:hypothetical protein
MKNHPDEPFTFSFDLHFTDGPILGPSAHIVLGSYSKDEAGTTYVTADCATPGELSYQVTRLKSELDSLLNRGRWRFVESINGHKEKRKRRKK